METKFKYLPQDKTVKDWGLYICDVGWQEITPGASYPAKQHPDGYYYTWETGRRLSEYQLCMIYSGSGIVEFEPYKPIALSKGSAFLLTPGKWHRCKPDAKTGWSSLWIGFNGTTAQRVVRNAFRTDDCSLVPIENANEFRSAAMRLITQVLKSGERKPFSSAGELLVLLGQIAEGSFSDHKVEDRPAAIRQAQSLIAERYAEIIDFKELARSVGMKYDVFRHAFTANTGRSPLQFQLEERLRTAKNLIVNTTMPMSDIARLTGFLSAAYFTRYFKAKTKLTPLEYRKARQVR